ncbi:hypothetical protein ACFYZ8_30280 [Streptomyces sp. NPDC001668]|uniref:hypothetical protein n=1 Tax=unclassified Streptomyces TaxID=2593676 RepID=UPI00369E292D
MGRPRTPCLHHRRPGRATGYAYDDAGNTTTVLRPDGHAMRALYDDLGVPVGITEEDGADGATRRYTYDERGNRLSATDPAGAVTRYTYDAALGHATTVERDAFGRVPAGGCATPTRR